MVQIIGSGLSNSENTVLVTDAQELFVRHPGSMQTFGNIGSVLITNNPVPISGIVNQGTNPWIILGSSRVVQDSTLRQISAGSIIVTGSVETFSASITTGSEAFLFGKSGTSWLPLKVISGIEATLVTNISNFSELGSSRIITAGSININNPSTIGSFTTQTIIGSTRVVQDSTLRQISAGSVIITNITAGSVEVFQTTNSDMQVQASQETSPWIVLGSVRVVQNSTSRQITAGSVNINNLSDLGSSRIITAGSFVLTNIGSVYNIEVNPNATILNNPAMKYEYIISGTATGITGSEIGSITQFIGAGSFVQVLTYSNDLVTNIGSWS